MTNRLNKTSICSVVFLDIAGYSNKPDSEQIAEKMLFNQILAEAVKDISTNERIILDTGDGAAITLTGEPEEALFASLAIRNAILKHNNANVPPLMVRIGINLGSVRVVSDINGQINVIGDAINVAQRIMSFSEPNQILVSRSYYEVASRLTKDFTNMFSYFGTRQDKHVREHEVYQINMGMNEVEAKAGLELGEVTTSAWKKLDESSKEIALHVDTSKVIMPAQPKQAEKNYYLWVIMPAIFAATILIFFNPSSKSGAAPQSIDLTSTNNVKFNSALSLEQEKQVKDRLLSFEDSLNNQASTEFKAEVKQPLGNVVVKKASAKTLKEAIFNNANLEEARSHPKTISSTEVSSKKDISYQDVVIPQIKEVHQVLKPVAKNKIVAKESPKECTQTQIALSQCGQYKSSELPAWMRR